MDPFDLIGKRIQDLSDLYDNNGPSATVQGSRNMNQGGRIGFEKGGPLTGEKFVEIVEKFPDYSNKQLLDYFNKNKFTNRSGDPLTTGAIKTQKSKFFDIAAETKSQTPKGYISSTEVFENLPISKKDYFRVKQAKEGGTLLTKEIDKLLKPVKIGDTFYFKKPGKNDSRSFSRLADKTGRLNNRIADLMLDFDTAYGKQFFSKGNVPDIDAVAKRFNITDSTAGKVTTRLAQWYGGQDFKNPQLKDLKRNKVTSNRLFKTLEKSGFGNPYRDGLYQIQLQTIDAKLGNKQGTFENFKNQAKQILKDNKIPVYDPKMGKNAFGFNINEIAGVTGSAKSKAAEFSQFVDVMEGNINTKAMAGFQSKLSTARAAIEKDPTKLSVESKKINKMAKNLEKTYGVELPRLQDPDATKYFSPKRLNELKTQGLDIVKAAERAGYTIQMPKGAQTITEFIDKPNLKQLINKISKTDPKIARQVGVKLNSGLPVDEILDEIKKIPGVKKFARGFVKLGGPFEVAFGVADAAGQYSQGKTPSQSIQKALQNITFGAYKGGDKADMKVLLDTAKKLNLDTEGFQELKDLTDLNIKIEKENRNLFKTKDYGMDPRNVEKYKKYIADLQNQFDTRGKQLQENLDFDTLLDNYTQTVKTVADDEFKRSAKSREDRVFPEMSTMGSDFMTTILNPIESFLPQNLAETGLGVVSNVTRPYVRAARKIPFIGSIFNPTSDAAILSTKSEQEKQQRVKDLEQAIKNTSMETYYSDGGIASLRKKYNV